MTAMTKEPRDPRVDPRPGDILREGDNTYFNITAVTDDRVYYRCNEREADWDWKSRWSFPTATVVTRGEP